MRIVLVVSTTASGKDHDEGEHAAHVQQGIAGLASVIRPAYSVCD